MDSNSVDNNDDGQEKQTTIGKAAELASNKEGAVKAGSSSSQPSDDTSDESSIDSSKKGSSELGSSEQESSKKELSQKETSDAAKVSEKKKVPEQVKADTKSAEKAKTTKPKMANTKASGGGGLFKIIVVLLLLLILAAAGAAGWWFYQQQQQAPAVEQGLVDQQQSLKRLEQRLNDERSERQSQQQAQAGLSQSINDVQLKINSHARRLRELSTTSRNDWLLAEAEYLIRLANQRLITERNTKNATVLLVTADGILRGLDEVDLLPVREALAKSITALRSAQMVDREGLYLQLNALSEQLVNLPLIEPELEKGAIPDEAGVSAAVNEESESLSQNWRDQLLQGFNAALDSASDLIRVRRRDTPLEPLPSVEEDHQVRYNLAIMLEQAQMALLREEQAIYEVSLQKAQQWLNSYFELNDSAAPLVDQLSELEQENVVQQLPDISEGLEVLRDYIDSWHKRHIVQKSPIVEKSGEAQAGEQ